MFSILIIFFLKKIFYLFTFRGRGREEEREGEKHHVCQRYINWLPLTHPQLGTWPATQACALTGNQTHDLLVGRLVVSPLSHTSQSSFYFFLLHYFVPLQLSIMSVLVNLKLYCEPFIKAESSLDVKKKNPLDHCYLNLFKLHIILNFPCVWKQFFI